MDLFFILFQHNRIMVLQLGVVVFAAWGPVCLSDGLGAPCMEGKIWKYS